MTGRTGGALSPLQCWRPGWRHGGCSFARINEKRVYVVPEVPFMKQLKSFRRRFRTDGSGMRNNTKEQLEVYDIVGVPNGVLFHLL